MEKKKGREKQRKKGLEAIIVFRKDILFFRKDILY
jgi:hypothetical protein